MNPFTQHNTNKLILDKLLLGDILQVSLVNKECNNICKTILHEKYKKINIKFFNHYYLLEFGCRTDDVSLVKYIITYYNISIRDKNNCFICSCQNGRLEIAKWLYSLNNIELCTIQYAFRSSCRFGHLEVAQWLYSLDVNHNAGNDYAFRYSCYNDHLEVAKWLCSLDSRYKIDIINNKIEYAISL